MLSHVTIKAISKIFFSYQPSYQGPEYGIGISTHNNLEEFFLRARVALCDEGTMATKATETLKYLNSDKANHRFLKALINEICDKRNYWDDETRHTNTISYLNDFLVPDGFKIEELNEKWQLSELSTIGELSTRFEEKLRPLEFDSVSDNFSRALSQAENDPEDAITAACSMLESVCKCLLDELGVAHPAKEDISSLVKVVGKELKLNPDREDISPNLEQDVKQVLGGLISVSKGVGALRTHAGDAHGKGKKGIRVDARIARLAIHSATTVSLFFIETWQRLQENSTKGRAK